MSIGEKADKPLTLGEVAEIFGVDKRTIQRWVKERRFPQPFRPAGINGKPFWRPSDIALFVEAGSIHSYRREKRRT